MINESNTIHFDMHKYSIVADCYSGMHTTIHTSIYTSVIYHRGASLSEQHNDLLRTKQDLPHTSRYVDESSPDSQVSRMYARTATLSVTTYA